MQSEQLFEAALGVSAPWYVREAKFDPDARTLTIAVDFRAGSRFNHSEAAGEHPVHDTQVKRFRHLNFFQHECHLEVRVPRVKLPDGAVRLVEPPWAGKLSGFSLLFEALVLCLCREMPFAAVAPPIVRFPQKLHTWRKTLTSIAETVVDDALATGHIDAVQAPAEKRRRRRFPHRALAPGQANRIDGRPQVGLATTSETLDSMPITLVA